MKSMIDVVYFCAQGSTWNDNELKYSLRSLEKYCKFRNVYIIGQLPHFVNKETVYFHRHANNSKNAAFNIMEKMKYACGITGLSEDFIFMNDDYFLTKPIPQPLPYYYKNTLEEAIKKNVGNAYQNHLIMTLSALQRKELPTKNFDTHCPMIVNREKMLEVINQYEWNIPWGLTLRSIYCNTLEIQGEFKQDCKLAYKRFDQQIERMIKDTFCFSIGDRAINKSLLNVMNKLYTNKSKFEL